MGDGKGAFLERQGNGVDVFVHWSIFILNNQCRKRQGKDRNKLIMRNSKKAHQGFFAPKSLYSRYGGRRRSLVRNRKNRKDRKGVGLDS